MKILYALCLIAVTFSSAAQSNVVTTNWVQASPAFREVDGRLYNTDKSKLWRDLHLQVLEKRGPNVFMAAELRAIYGQADINDNQRIGAYVSPINTRRILGYSTNMLIMLTNAPDSMAIGQDGFVHAMKVGTAENGYELWDHGTPHFVAIVRTNWVQALPVVNSSTIAIPSTAAK